MTFNIFLTRFIGRLDAPIPLASGDMCTLESLTDPHEIERVAGQNRISLEHPLSHRPLGLKSAIQDYDAFRDQKSAAYDVPSLATRIATDCIVVRFGKWHARQKYPADLRNPDERRSFQAEASRALAIAHVVEVLLSETSPPPAFVYSSGVFFAVYNDAFCRGMFHAYTGALHDLRNLETEPSNLWRNVHGRIQELANLLIPATEGEHLGHLEYTGEILGAIRDTVDPKLKLVLLISLLEMFLTHNPDFKRYNVEDSITKQFALKMAVLLHDAGDKDLVETKARLTTLYALRSAIAHGDFEKMREVLKKSKDRESTTVESQVSLAYNYLRVVLFRFLRDPAYVNFLKAN